LVFKERKEALSGKLEASHWSSVGQRPSRRIVNIIPQSLRLTPQARCLMTRLLVHTQRLFLEASILISQKYNHKMSIWNESHLCTRAIVNAQICHVTSVPWGNMQYLGTLSPGDPALFQWPSSHWGNSFGNQAMPLGGSTDVDEAGFPSWKRVIFLSLWLFTMT
jgi:hypothetical protein